MQTIQTIIEALPPGSRRALEKFLRSPYHVTHAGVGELYERIKLPENTSAASFSGDQKRIYHLSNYLLEALEAFLALEHWQEQPHQVHAETVAALRKLQLPEQAGSMLRYARRRLEQDHHRGLAHHQYEYRLQSEAYHLSLQQGRAKTHNAQTLSDAQDIAFICDKLRTGCLLLSHESVTKQNYDKGLLQNVLEFLEGHSYLEIPAVAAYYHGYHAQLGAPGSEDHFSELKTLLQTRASLFSLEETHDLFLMAINFCIRKINRHENAYMREIFELYQSGLEHGALLEGGVLSRWTFNNITTTALRLREFSWLERFLQEFAPLLPEEHRDGAVHFNLARFHYEKNEWRAAMKHLLQIEYDDVLQNLSAKILLGKIYFELGEHDALENQLDSIQIYIRRKKVLGYHRDNFMAFVRFIRKTMAIPASDQLEKQRLRQEIQNTLVLTEREWLLSKL